MMVIRSGPVLRQIEELFSLGASGSLSDAELLAGFLAGRGEASEAAFAALVERHGPMVLRVCRILLGDAHEAEDAFQATFLVLAKKAGSLRNPDRLANWLYGAAHRTACKSRSRAGRRKLHDSGDDQMSVLDVARRELPLDLALSHREQAAIIHQELDRLPEKHRTVIVLCCLEELTIEEAARRLRCTAGAVRGRLSQGRARLRAMLSRRGVAVPAGVMAAALSTRAASAAVTPAIRDATAHAAMAYSAGIIPAGCASGSALALADEVSRSMLSTRLAVATAFFTGMVALGAIATAFTLQNPTRAAGSQKLSASPREATGQAAAGTNSREHRRLVEELEWFLTDVDPGRGTISIHDLPDLRLWEMRPRAFSTDGIAPGLALRGLTLSSPARVTLDSKAADLTALRPGMRVAVHLAPDRFAAAEVRATSPMPPDFVYVLNDVDAAATTVTVTLRQKNLRLEKIRVAADARIVRLGTDPKTSVTQYENISLRDLRPGVRVSLILSVTEGGGLVVTLINSTGIPAE